MPPSPRAPVTSASSWSTSPAIAAARADGGSDGDMDTAVLLADGHGAQRVVRPPGVAPGGDVVLEAMPGADDVHRRVVERGAEAALLVVEALAHPRHDPSLA